MRRMTLTTTSTLAAALFATAAFAQVPAPSPATSSTTTQPTQSTTAAQPPSGTATPNAMPGMAGESGAAAPGAAAPSGGPTQGASVYGPQGNVVGTIESVDGQYATIATASNVRAKLPLSSFGTGDKGPTLSMTAAQLEAAAGGQPAAGASPQAGGAPAAAGATAASGSASGAASTAIEAGATVNGPQGGRVGTIEAIDGEFATIATAKNKVRVPKSSLASGPDAVLIGMTEAQLDAAAEAAKPKTASR